jgi:hypothetical protein
MEASIARTLWATAEPLHALTYFAPEVRAATEAAGLRGFWRGYFATRAAPLGAVGPGPVTAAFYNFAPTMVARAVPGVWVSTPPERAWAARLDGIDAALEACFGGRPGSDDALAEAADLAVEAVAGAPVEGRVLGAAYAGLHWPASPRLALWQALTALRELRGDGHNAALLAAGIDGCAAHVLFAATGGSARGVTQPNRGWTDEDWDAAAARLADRGLIDGERTATEAGHARRAGVEAATDRLAAGPWAALGPTRTERLRALLAPLSQAVVGAGIVPVPNPIGSPWPPPR